MSDSSPEEVTPEPPMGPWGSLIPEETGLVAFWPHRESPTLEEVSSAIRTWVGEDVVVTDAEESEDENEEPSSETLFRAVPIDVDDTDTLWGLQLTVPSMNSAIILWAEAATQLGKEEREQLGTASADSPWVIRAQTVLQPGQAADDYFMLMNILAGALPDIVGILDVVTSQQFHRKQLDEIFVAKDALPVDHVLWRLGRFDGKAAGDPILLASTGLRRCGLPELEVIELPAEHAQAAVITMHTLASLLLEGELPAPGDAIDIGDGLQVCLRLSTSISDQLPDHAPGHPAWRKRMASLGMPRFQEVSAVVCERGPQEGQPTAWHYPRETITAIESGTAVLYISSNEANAEARRAQATFPSFATAWGSLHRANHPDWNALAEKAFLVQAPLDMDPSDERIEQVWFQLRSIERGSVHAILIESSRSDPTAIAGQERVIPIDQISNWRVELPDRSYGPSETDILLAAIDQTRGIEGTTP
ncbi:MAG: hypothetical protein O2800_05640 [Planctomycetota bacterium]|nr:hypothetical protein [Planctomycetota bacterium]